MGSKKPKVKTYDPSKYEANIQLKKMALSQKINDSAMSTQQRALDASEEGLKDLYDGIGLFTNYMDKRIDQQNQMSNLYGGYNQEGLLSLYDVSRNAAKTLIDDTLKRYQ